MTESTEYPHLFQPAIVGSMQFKNRMIMLPMIMSMDPRGEQWRAFLTRRAEGGFAAIIHAAIATDLLLSDKCWGEPGAVEHLEASLRKLTEGVHEFGVKIGLQLLQLNCIPQIVAIAQTFPNTPPEPLPEVEWVAPSTFVEPDPFIHGGNGIPGLPLREMTIEEIEEVIDRYVKAAGKAKEIGFDFIEIHGAHGVLPCQFLSPLDNHRTDKYGGDPVKRMRFGLEILDGIKGSVGRDFPVFYRLPGEDNIAGGITLADSTAFAVELEKAGVDCIDVSIGVSPDREFRDQVAPAKDRGEGVFIPLAEAVKRSVQVPVIGVANIRTPRYAESILAEGKADLIGMGRQPVTDPDWPKKAMEGRLREIIPCDSCNLNCWRGPFGPMPEGLPYCKMNFEAGREWESTSANRD